MKNMKSIVVVAVLVIAVAAVIAAKQGRRNSATSMPETAKFEMTHSAVTEKALPRLVDLGADKCIPCRMMAPILEELKTTHVGQLEVEFIDVWKNPAAGQKYGIRVIPTQIFFGPNGEELARHEGFMSREDILAQWTKLGFTFKKPDVQ